MMERIDTIANKFVKLGFTEYEAKILAALMMIGPATAREIHELSGVPRPKIYETLKSLAKKGYIEIQYGKPLIFVPLSQETLIEKLRSSFATIIDSLVHDIKQFTIQKKSRPIYTSTLVSENSILFKLREMISKAKREIKIVVADPRILLPVKNILKAASDRGITIDCIMLEYDRAIAREVKKFTKVYVLDFQKILDVFQELLARIRESEPLIAAVNIDREEVFLIFKEEEMMGVWIKVRAVAEVQALIIDTVIGRTLITTIKTRS